MGTYGSEGVNGDIVFDVVKQYREMAEKYQGLSRYCLIISSAANNCEDGTHSFIQK